jgi:hypothetical protein
MTDIIDPSLIDPNTIDAIKDFVLPTATNTIGAFANSLFSYMYQKGYRSWENKKEEKEARDALEGSVTRTFAKFAHKYQEYTESFFDEQFLKGRALGIVGDCIYRWGPPKPRELASAYADYLNRVGPARDQLIDEVEPAARFFLENLMEELARTGKFGNELDSQAFEATAANTASIAAATDATANNTNVMVEQGERVIQLLGEVLDATTAQANPTVELSALLQAIGSANLTLRNHEATILGEHILRPEVATIIDWVLHAEADKQFGVLLDQPGAGKTGVMRDVLLDLERRGIPVLALKANALSAVNSPDELLDILRLPCSIEEAAQYVIATKGLFVLLVDQLDALSYVLARDPDALHVVLDTIARLRSIGSVRIVASCRTFDLHTDPELSRVKVDRQFSLQPLSESDVERLLAVVGVDAKQLLDGHRKLLSVPLHLDIYTRIVHAEANKSGQVVTDPYFSLQELYGRLWSRVVDFPASDRLANAAAIDTPVAAIYALVSAMSAQKAVSVPVSTLDKFGLSTAYLLEQGLIHEEGLNLRFIHHTFFDYAYARRFVGEGGRLCENVRGGAQGLFERSMVVQVLAYLRGTNPQQYIDELSCLLRSDDVHLHIKSLVLGWFGTLPRVLDEEVEFAHYFMNTNTGLLLTLASMSGNTAWFDKLNAAGFLAGKLAHNEEPAVNGTVNYLGTVINSRTVEVLQLLQPYVGRSEAWDLRVLHCLVQLKGWQNEQAINIVSSILRRGHILGTYNLGFHEMAVSNPAGGCRAVRAYLDVWLEQERKADASEDAGDQQQLLARMRRKCSFMEGSPMPYGLNEVVREAAQHNPRELLDQLLPWLIAATSRPGSLEASTEHYYADNIFSIFSSRADAQNIDDVDVVPVTVSIALAELAKTDIDAFLKFAQAIEVQDSQVLQTVLAQAYRADPELHATRIANYLLADPRRYNLDAEKASDYVSHQLFAAAMQYSDAETRQALEEYLHGLQIGYEADSPKYKGLTELGFLLAVPQEQLTRPALLRMQELRRKFPDYKPEKPRPMIAGIVGPPIPAKAMDKMTDAHWLSAMREYDDSTEHHVNVKRPLAGGVSDLSGAFAGQVEKEPQRSYDLSAQFDERISAHYKAALISGLGGESAPAHLLFDAVRRFVPVLPDLYRGMISQAIENKAKAGTKIPEDLLALLEDWTQPDLDAAEEHPEKPLTTAINSNRGRALEALCTCLLRPEPAETDRAFRVLQRAAEDPSGAVRAMVIRWLIDPGIYKSDFHHALGIFMRAVDGYPELLGTPGAYDMIHGGCHDRFEEMRPFIEAMLGSSNRDIQEQGAILACLAALRYPQAQDLAERAMTGDVAHRSGAARVYSQFASKAQRWEACQSGLRRLMNDDDAKVRSPVGACFLHLQPGQIASIRPFLMDFLNSASLPEGAAHLSAYVERIAKYEHDLALQVTAAILDAVDREKAQPSDASAFSAGTPLSQVLRDEEFVRLPITVYMKSHDDEKRRAAMTMFDRLLILGSYQAHAVLSEWDRR